MPPDHGVSNYLVEKIMHPQGKVWDRFAKRYAKQPVADEDAYQKKLQVTREVLRPGMEMLEFGCGTGSTAIAQAGYVKHVLALDVSAKMLDIARGRAAAAGAGNITFEQIGIEAFEPGGRRFDVIMGHSILHLLEDRDAVIAKVHDMLKPGGLFVSSTICLGGGMHVLRLILPLGGWLGLLPLARFFSVDDLLDSLESAGFTIDHQWRPEAGKTVFMVAKKAL